MISVDEFKRLQTKVESVKKEVSQAEGALAEQMKRMKKEFGCSTLEEAETKLESLVKKAKKAEEKHISIRDDFMEKWGKELEIG